jgi:hypothetical protein
MPQFTLAPQQVDGLVTAVLAQTERAQKVPAALRIASRRQSDYHAAGKAGQLIEDMRCFSCRARCLHRSRPGSAAVHHF